MKIETSESETPPFSNIKNLFISATKSFKIMAPCNHDLFSSLSYSVLVHIISNLPFKEAVRTCILSWQWRNVWRESTNLEFNENFFVSLHENDGTQFLQRIAFFEFIKEFIASYPHQAIKKFALACSNPDGFRLDVQSFISFAISRNVKELELDFSYPGWSEYDLVNHPSVVDLPLQAYRHSGLQSLKLFSCNFDVSMVSNFATLKEISLGWIKISKTSIGCLLLNCPLLESLNLKKCCNVHEHFEILLPNLKLNNLVLDKCNFLHDMFLIAGPKIRFLKYSGKIGFFRLLNQRDMEEVDLDFGMENESVEDGAILYELLQELYSARVLTVCSVFLQIVAQGEKPSRLHPPLDVRHLILNTALHFNEFHGIRFMLRSSPYLETLTLDIGSRKIFPNRMPPFQVHPHEFWSTNVKVENCIHSTLQVVNVKGFKGTSNELCVLKYIVCYGRRLQKLNLYISDEVGEDEIFKETCMESVQRIREFNSSSPNLQIFVF